MRFINSRRRLILTVSIITVVGLLILFLRRLSPPFHIGSAVDDVWTYIHTDSVRDGFSGKILPINKRTRWTADTAAIQSEATFSWNKRSFLFQKTTYAYTNGTITGVDSDWKVKWPF